MVYYGPSRGCFACRKRKVKCDLTRPSCNNCRKRGVDCSGPRVGFNEPDFRPLRLPTKTWVNSEFPIVQTKMPSVRGSNYAIRQLSPMSDSSDSSDDPFFLNTVTVPHMPADGAYGNAYLGVYRANSTLFELLHLWQVKFLSTSATGTASALSRRALSLSSLALFDDCKGYSWISSMASYHNLLTESTTMRQVQIESHAQAVVNLREKFNKYSGFVPLLASLNTLINAEFAAGDYATAKHHTRFLADELNPATCKSPLIVRLRHTVMILELERAIATFSKPVFDINAWAACDQAQELLSSRSQTLAIRFPPTAPKHLDTEALSDPRLVDVFTRIHHLDNIFKTIAISDTVTRGFAFQLSWAAIQLENDVLLHCLDLFDIAVNSRSPSCISLDQKAWAHLDRCQSAAAVLASLFYLRLRLRCEQSGTESKTERALMERFWSVGPLLAKRMETLLQKSDDIMKLVCGKQKKLHRFDSGSNASVKSLAESISPAIRLRLWVSYVGTWIEATAWYRTGKCTSYFSETFNELCNEVFGIETSDVRQRVLEHIIEGFIVLEHCADNRNTTVATLKQGPEWLSPALRTWGFANWDGDLA